MTNAEETYDFIVTGAGSAGCAVAGRLSESGRYRVLLLEAGTRDSNPWIHIPLGYTKTYTDPRVNWMFESEPEKELNGRTLYQPRGKVLGGTSSINGMVYMRGTPTDYDGWRQRGCEGWDWDLVLPFFKRAEDQERGANDFHGVGGPLHVSNPVRCPLGDAMVKAAIEAGIPANDDFNGARQEGVGYYQTTTSNRRRWSSARAYLGPARGRPNLTIATEAHATRILFDGARAVGIEYHTPEGRKTARVRGEIIVSGGVYGSPQLLQLSGLGPAISWPSTASRSFARSPVSAPICTTISTPTSYGAARKRSRSTIWRAARCSRSWRASSTRSAAPAICQMPEFMPAPLSTATRASKQPDLQINMSGWSAIERLAHRDQAAPILGLHHEPSAFAPGRPRHGAHQEPGSVGAAGNPLQFSVERLRFSGADLRHAAQPQDRRAAGAEAIRRRGSLARPTMRQRRPT